MGMPARCTLAIGLTALSWCSVATTARATQWRAPVAVPGMHEAFTSRVALSRDGTLAVAGVSSFTGYVAVRRPNGRWAATHRLGGLHTLVSSPFIAFDAHGRLLLVWTTAKRVGTRGFAWQGPYMVLAQTWTNTGGWGAVRTLGPAKNFTLAQPQIAVDTRGEAIAAWWGYRRAGRRNVEAVSTSLRPAGGGWQAMQQTSSGGPYRYVALDGKGNAYLVWTTYTGPRNWFSMRPSETRRWGAPRLLPGRPASDPTVAANPDGAAVIAWRAALVDSEGEGTQYGPPRAIVRSPEGGWSKVLALSPIHTHDVRMALAPNGTILLSWAPAPLFGPGVAPGQTDVHFSLFSRSRSLSTERDAPGTGLGPIAYRRNGDAILAFGPEALEGFNPRGQGPIRFTALVPKQATFSEPVPIVAHGGAPSLATPAAGSNPIEAATVFYDEAAKRLELSLLTRGPREPLP